MRPRHLAPALALAALAGAAQAHSNTFVGSAELYEAEAPGGVSTEYWLTYVGAHERSWQHSGGMQVGLWRGLEAQLQATFDVSGDDVTPVQLATGVHLQLGREGQYPVDVALEWKPYEREVEQDGVHHRTGFEVILARDLGDLSIGISGGVDFPDLETDFAGVLRYPRHGRVVGQLLLVDEPDAGKHHVVLWPSLEVTLRDSLSIGAMVGAGLTPDAAPFSARTAVSWRVR